MKHIKSFFAITGLALSMLAISSCEKTLDIDAPGFVSTDSVIRTEADLFRLVNSGYYALADNNYYGGAYQIYSDLLADHIAGETLGGDYQGAYNRNANIFNTGVSDLYAQISKPVFQGNLVLDHIDLATGANADNLEGQAKFLRAIAFFDMVRLYAQPYTTAGASNLAGIPLRLVSERQRVVRKSVAEAYQQIIMDLKSAEELLPATNDVYATKWTAKALLARVYFQMNDFPNAFQYANDVLENSGFNLDPNHFNRYSSAGTSEAILQLVYETNAPSGRFSKIRGDYNTLGGALPTLRLTASIYSKATANGTDKRKPWYKTRDGFYLLGKFDSTVFKMPVILTTEMLLIRAESAAETNTNLTVAIADMNEIISRAYGNTSPLLLPAGANAALIKDAARRERELEFVGEGYRIHELKRLGAKGEAVSIRGAIYNCPGMIFPFPTNEVIYSAPEFIQNPSGNCN